jgi:hypothetical protein
MHRRAARRRCSGSIAQLRSRATSPPSLGVLLIAERQVAPSPTVMALVAAHGTHRPSRPPPLSGWRELGHQASSRPVGGPVARPLPAILASRQLVVAGRAVNSRAPHHVVRSRLLHPRG